MYLEFDKSHHTSCHRFLITPKLFVFFYAASLGCLLPFLPIFFRLNGLSAVQNGCLVAARYLVLFWAAPMLSFFASKLNARKAILVLAVLLGTVANTSFLFTAEYKHTLEQQGCHNDVNGTHVGNMSSLSSLKVNNTINYNIETHGDKIITFDNKFEQEIFNTIGLTFDKKFLTFLLIVVVGTILSSPAKPLHELVTLAIIKEFKESYNVQRLCSCLGWSLLSLATVVVIYYVPCILKGFTNNIFDLHFCFHIVFSTTALIFAGLMKSPTQKTTTKLKFCRILKVSCKNANVIVIIFAMAILGMAQSINSSYLFWYIQDLGGNELHMGLIVLVSGLSQIPLLFVTKYFIHWLGHGWVFFLSLSAYGCRFILYSYINHPLMVLPIELLHSLTSSSIWLTSMSVAVLVSPIGLERSMQNLFTASYYGLGMGVGGVLSSVAYQLYGPVQVFQCTAAVCAVYSLVLALLQCLISPPDENQGFPINGDYYKVGVTGSSAQQSDWLLDALNAEEEEEEIHYTR